MAFPTRRRSREHVLVQPNRTRSVLRTAKPSRVAVDKTAIKINGEWSWLYAAIDIGTKIILYVQLFGRHGTDPEAAFLHGLSEKHDRSKTVFLVDGYDYQTAFNRLGLSGRLDYVERNPIKK